MESHQQWGAIDEWLWKGAVDTPIASIGAIVGCPSKGHFALPPPVPLKVPPPYARSLRYRLAFTKAGFRFEIMDELVEESSQKPAQQPYYAFVNGRPTLRDRGQKRTLSLSEINPQLSILAQLKDPHHYPEITYLGKTFIDFQIFRDWEFGTISTIREPCDYTLPDEQLEEDGSNLGVVLARLLALPPVKQQILESLRTFYEDAKDLRTSIEGGKVQTRLEEKHLNATIPLVRMSDGTIRWLALLAILLNPDPPPLVCIEEPELGLHPDMIHELGKLLIDASTRMQLIITTHSDRLVEEFTERPEAVVVCEKEDGASTLRRLNRDQLSSWLDDYSLGQLWTKGELGGTRW